MTCNEPPRPPDVTRNGKGATHVRSISFEGEQGTLVMGGWADRCRRRPPALFAKKDPPPPSSTFRSTRAPRSAVGTPHRFRTKRQFWPYCGYAVVTRSSADYQLVEGKIVKQRKKVSTRGLNRNHNPQLKQVFKSAALTALRHEAVKAYLQRLMDRGVRPELARVSLARKLAAIALTLWQRREEFDLKKAFAQD